MDRDDRRKSIKSFQTTYEKYKFTGVFEEDWSAHFQDFIAMTDEFEVMGEDRIYFLRYSLRGDARQFYNSLVEQNKNWQSIANAFAERYYSDEKAEEISNRFVHLTIEDCRTPDGDDYTALDALIERINTLAPMAKAKDKDEEAKVRCLRESVRGTEWGLRETMKVGDRNSYQTQYSH